MEIYDAILGVMTDVGAIGKGKKNTQQGFKYRGIDDVMNALQPAMVKHKIFVVPVVLEQKREERRTGNNKNLIYSICTVKYTFYAKDGSSVEAIVIGEGMDSGDKATNKAMSVAFKYACFQVFCIPTEEMKDPDADTSPESEPNAPPEPKPKPEKPVPRLSKLVNDTKRLLVKLYGDAAQAEAYWKENIAADENDRGRMEYHYKAIKSKVALMENDEHA